MAVHLFHCVGERVNLSILIGIVPRIWGNLKCIAEFGNKKRSELTTPGGRFKVVDKAHDATKCRLENSVI